MRAWRGHAPSCAIIAAGATDADVLLLPIVARHVRANAAPLEKIQLVAHVGAFRVLSFWLCFWGSERNVSSWRETFRHYLTQADTLRVPPPFLFQPAGGPTVGCTPFFPPFAGDSSEVWGGSTDSPFGLPGACDPPFQLRPPVGSAIACLLQMI